MPKEWTKSTIAVTIDHTLLKPTATAEQIRELCAEARANRFAAVCVNSRWVSLAAKELSGTEVLTCAVVGFPLGAAATEIKAEEARLAIKHGAQEIDMVIDLGSLKGGDHKSAEEDIRAVVKAAGKAAVKVIIETCYLSNDEKRLACEIAFRAGARFVETSTGFGTEGAASEDVKLLKKSVPESVRVKAAGSIRSYHDAIAMLEAGADRIGSSSGVAIVSELPE